MTLDNEEVEILNYTLCFLLEKTGKLKANESELLRRVHLNIIHTNFNDISGRRNDSKS